MWTSNWVMSMVSLSTVFSLWRQQHTSMVQEVRCAGKHASMMGPCQLDHFSQRPVRYVHIAMQPASTVIGGR